MADTTKTVMLVGVLGAGGYLAYEYYRYSSAISALAGGDATSIANGESALPFFTYLSMTWGGSGTTAQVQIYNMIQQYLTTGQVASTSGATTPGTTQAGQPTSVSTVSTTTGATSSSTAPTTTSQPQPPAPQPVSRVPITSSRPGLAVLMQQKINMTIANADQWNWAYGQIMGQGIDHQYGINFDSIYGAVVGGARSSGTMSAQAFLQMAAAAVPGGLGTIATFAGPALLTQGNMIYAAHHPFPYVPTYTLKGLGAVTQATGFEKALFTNRLLRSNRVL